MSEASSQSQEPTLPGISEPTSSPALGDGTLPLNLPDGTKTRKYGRGRAPVSLFQPLGKEKGQQTSGTSGPSLGA